MVSSEVMLNAPAAGPRPISCVYAVQVITAEGDWLEYTILQPPLLLEKLPPTYHVTFAIDAWPPGSHKV